MDVSLTDGPVPAVVLVLGGVALVVLLWRRGRSALVGPVVAVLVGLLVYLALNWLVVDVLGLVPEALPDAVTLWIAVAAAALVLAGTNLVRATLGRRLLALLCALLVLLTAGSQINTYFSQYPTLAALVGADDSVQDFRGVPGRRSVAEPGPAVQRWTGTPSGTSSVQTATIPGTVSGFAARDAYIYLPAVYDDPDAPLLPVLVLVSGQPGGPQDWTVGGQLQTLLDRFAAANDGLAPVAVVVDPNGSDGGNTMCMDSQIAKADTYLSQDVPNWIVANLGIDANHAHWAFGGWSYGGTCAVQMATRHPDLYPSFFDAAGEREPAISADRDQTIQQAFGGDAAAFDALTPLTVLADKRFPDSWGYFSVGGDENPGQAWMTEVSTAAQDAGMTVRTQVVPGQGHSWAVPNASLDPALQFLGPRTGLTR